MATVETESLLGNYRRAVRPRHRSLLMLVAILFGGLSLGLMLFWQTLTGPVENRKVELEAHIMSKCPDARDCLEMLVVPVLRETTEMTDFKLSYIGRIDGGLDYGVACKHGASECLSNMLGLCAAELYPEPKIYVGFMLCMTNSYNNLPERPIVEKCALEYGIELDRLSACVSDDMGTHAQALLQASVRRSDNANVTRSCTVRLDDKVWCVRDGGVWQDCESDGRNSNPVVLVDEIRRRYEHLNRYWS